MKKNSLSWITGCFAIVICLLLGITYSGTTEAAECKHNGYITESIAIDEYRKSKNTDGYYNSVPKSECGDEWLFAGWYEDSECTKPLANDVVTGTYIAKFVPSHVLGVKAQIPVSLLNAEDATTGDMRFVTSVDSVQYHRVGISVLLPTGKTFSSSQRGVYENLYAVGDDNVVQSYRANEVFCSVSRYFKAYTIRQIPSQYFDADFKVTPYWITLDGSFVNGETVIKNMKQCLNDVTKLVIDDSTHGTVTADMEHYYVGDIVTLQVTPDENYDCTTLTVDGKEIRSEEEGTYLFEATKTQHTIKADFERKIFVDADGWDVSKQHEGIVTLKNGGNNYNLHTVEQYTDVDMTVTVKEDMREGVENRRTDVLFKFANNKHLSLSITADSSKGYIQSMQVSNTITTGSWPVHWTMTAEELAAYQSETGLDFRVIREGTTFKLYLGNQLRKTLDFAGQIESTTEAYIYIRNFGTTGADVEVPFRFGDKVFADASGWDLTKQHEGVVTLKNGGYNGNLYMADKYTDIDLTLIVRNYAEIADGNDSPSTAVKFNFTNGKHVQFRILNQPPSQTGTETGAVYLQVMGESGSLLNWGAPYKFSDTEKALFESATGVEFRIVKMGTIFTFYINGEQKHQIDLSTNGLTADMEAGINIRHWGDAGVDIELPFAIKNAVTFKGATMGHGTITSTPAICYEGDTVTLKVTPDAEYDCIGLKVDGKTVNMNTDGTYSFVAKKTVYKLEASYQRKIFADASGWDLSKQYEGIVTLINNGGYNGNLYTTDKYTDVDLTLTVRNYAEIADGNDSPRTAVKFNFANGKHVQFSILNQPPSQTGTETGAVYLQVMGESGSLLNWGAPYKFSDTEKALFESATGVEFRIVKVGTIFTFYINGEQKHQITLSTNDITADMEAGINIRHWGDAGVDIELPFVIKNVVSIKGLTSGNGIVKTEKTKYFVGDTVNFTVSPDTGYYCISVTVNGKTLTADENGRYSFVADKDVCRINVTYG